MRHVLVGGSVVAADALAKSPNFTFPFNNLVTKTNPRD
jgi:hypothetical protein